MKLSENSILTNRAEREIRTAVKAYSAHTSQTDILDDISPEFIRRLAEDSTSAKSALRAFLSRSPLWVPELDALKIPGELPADVDSHSVDEIADRILFPAQLLTVDPDKTRDIETLREYVVNDTVSDEMISALSRIDPKAYKPGRKKSRVFRDCCKALGIADESAGSDFSRNFAKLSDLLNVSPRKFTLYVSINPAHFLTMSNPKGDERGSTLTSCHSLNGTEYPYNNGCSGYARDSVTMIAFTVADDEDPETFYNRKTTRQIYAYKPGNGVLLQSRMYNTAGGTYGAMKETAVYRGLIQKVISDLEGVPDVWEMQDSYRSDYVSAHRDFGGYTDWTYSSFGGNVCLLDAFADSAEPITVGAAGLCVVCGCKTSEGMYCDDHREEDGEPCEECGDRTDPDELWHVYYHGRNWTEERMVCEWCRDRSYTYCDSCEEYHNNDSMTRTGNGDWVCERCLEEFYSICDDCEEYYPTEDFVRAVDEDGNEKYICDDCRRANYTYCDECEVYRPDELFTKSRDICDDCMNRKEEDEENEEDIA